LVAVYRLDRRPLLTELLARGERRVHAFTERCGARVVSSADLADVDAALDSLRNVNDRESYERAMRDISA